MKKTKPTAASPAPLPSFMHRQDLPCKLCQDMVWDVAGNIASVICWRCVVAMTDPPNFPTKVTEIRPRGWQFRSEYVSPSGQVYHRGQPVDAVTAKKKPKISPSSRHD